MMLNIRLTSIACIAALIGVAGAAGTAHATGPSNPADPSPSSSQDSMYLDMLTRQGFTYSSPQAAINVARYVCAAFANGESYDNVAVVGLKNTSLSPDNVGHVIGAAITAYCPQYFDMLPRP
jgi:Protein of unknown function (DUF732)